MKSVTFLSLSIEKLATFEHSAPGKGNLGEELDYV
jgi:hypothetical protein